HSFLIDRSQIDVTTILYHEDQRYMEDYFMMLQIASGGNSDWEGLGQNEYIGDYLHSLDRRHTLAFSGEAERRATLDDPLYRLCEERVREMQRRLLEKLKI